MSNDNSEQPGVDSNLTVAYGPNLVDLVTLPDGRLGLAVSIGEVEVDVPATGLVLVATFEPFVDKTHALGVILALVGGELVAADEEVSGILDSFDTVADIEVK